MLKLGVIGFGPVWETYRAIFGQLRHPPAVTAFFEPNPAIAVEKAKQLRATSAPGVLALAERPDVQAILLTDPGWIGAGAIDLLARCQKPVFIADWQPTDMPTAAHWFAATEQHGVTLMPAMWRRFMPSTLRLKELLATDLGEPLEISMLLDLSANSTPLGRHEAVIGWLDFVWYLVRREPQMESACSTSSAGTFEWQILFPPRQPHPIEGASSSARRACHLRVQWLLPDGADSVQQLLQRGCQRSEAASLNLNFEEQPIPQIELHCDRGSATLVDRTTVQWKLQGNDQRTEQLTADRPERLIMLDHFGRRAVGGLIPVADYNDVARVLRLLAQGK